MSKALSLIGLVLAVRIGAAPLPPAAPIITAEELRAAAANVQVARIDFAIPEKEAAAEDALAKRFFNQPEEHRYSGLTNADWRGKWQLFSDALVAKAKTAGLDSTSLEAGLRALNQGRNRQTMMVPAFESEVFPPDTPKEKIEAFEKKAEEKYQQALKEREKHPAEWYNDHLAIVPVSAYLGRHANSECWIIVCMWEGISDEPLGLGHMMIWALDTQSAAVVAYVTCD